MCLELIVALVLVLILVIEGEGRGGVLLDELGEVGHLCHTHTFEVRTAQARVIVMQRLGRGTDLAGALVGDGGVLLVAGEEEDGGEAADVHAGHLDLVRGRVHL